MHGDDKNKRWLVLDRQLILGPTYALRQFGSHLGHYKIKVLIRPQEDNNAEFLEIARLQKIHSSLESL